VSVSANNTAVNAVPGSSRRVRALARPRQKPAAAVISAECIAEDASNTWHGPARAHPPEFRRVMPPDRGPYPGGPARVRRLPRRAFSLDARLPRLWSVPEALLQSLIAVPEVDPFSRDAGQRRRHSISPGQVPGVISLNIAVAVPRRTGTPSINGISAVPSGAPCLARPPRSAPTQFINRASSALPTAGRVHLALGTPIPRDRITTAVTAAIAPPVTGPGTARGPSSPRSLRVSASSAEVRTHPFPAGRLRDGPFLVVGAAAGPDLGLGAVGGAAVGVVEALPEAGLTRAPSHGSDAAGGARAAGAPGRAIATAPPASASATAVTASALLARRPIPGWSWDDLAFLVFWAV
jgi:hypothetical protein